jgi:hypothetical protein
MAETRRRASATAADAIRQPHQLGAAGPITPPLHGKVELQGREFIVTLGCALAAWLLAQPPNEHDKIWEVQRELDFPKYVFGVSGPPPGGTIMDQVLPRYARLLARHKADKAL